MQPFEADLTQDLIADCDRRIRILPLTPLILVPMYVVILLALWPQVPSTEAFGKIALLLLGLMLVGGGLALPYVLGDRNRLVTARKAAGDAKLILRIDDRHLQVPVLLLGDPGFWRATEDGKRDLVIPISDIAGVTQQKHNVLIQLRGTSAIWGQGVVSIGEPRLVLKRKFLREEYFKI